MGILVYILSYYLIVYDHISQVIKKEQRNRQHVGTLKHSELGPEDETEETRSGLRQAFEEARTDWTKTAARQRGSLDS